MSPLTVLIVDDEAPARMLLRELLAAHEDIEVVGDCTNGLEAVGAVAALRPDLLLLDVQMPRLSGFEVLELLEPPPMVIFTTAYDQYAVQAFEVHAVDYLLKPFGAERLATALKRARAAGSGPQSAAVRRLAEELRRGKPLERLLVREGERVHVVPTKTIDLLEAQGDAVEIRAGATRLRKPVTLGELEQQLDPERFLRVHRSYILNLDRIAGLELYAKDSRVAVLRDGTRVPVSRNGYARLRELL